MTSRLPETGEPLLVVKNLKKYFPVKKGLLIDRTVDNVKAVGSNANPGATLTAQLVTPPPASQGTVTLNANGGFTFTLQAPAGGTSILQLLGADPSGNRNGNVIFALKSVGIGP